jgi:Tol biopolymer transport system component
MGYLVYIREGTVFAAPFDPVRLELRGAALPLLEDVASSSGLGIGRFAFSATGTFVYSAGTGTGQGWAVVWLNNRGTTEPLLAKPGAYDTPRLSPDGQRLALQVTTGRSRDLYVYDLPRDTLSRLTFTGGASPVWAPDGKHLVFSTRNSLWWIRTDGSGEPQLLLEGKTPLNAYSFSPDSRHLAYFVTSADTQNDIWTVSVDMADSEHPKLGPPEVFLKTMFTELEPAFSPDGRWIAYRSNESGTVELYVRPFHGAAKWQISSGGVMHPRWSPAGRQLFYETLDGHIMVADYSVQGDAFVASRPRLWTETRILAPSGAYNLDVAPDGQRFVVFPEPDVTAADKGPVHVTFLINFFDELRRRMPLK